MVTVLLSSVQLCIYYVIFFKKNYVLGFFYVSSVTFIYCSTYCKRRLNMWNRDWFAFLWCQIEFPLYTGNSEGRLENSLAIGKWHSIGRWQAWEVEWRFWNKCYTELRQLLLCALQQFLALKCILFRPVFLKWQFPEGFPEHVLWAEIFLPLESSPYALHRLGNNAVNKREQERAYLPTYLSIPCFQSAVYWQEQAKKFWVYTVS